MRSLLIIVASLFLVGCSDYNAHDRPMKAVIIKRRLSFLRNYLSPVTPVQNMTFP